MSATDGSTAPGRLRISPYPQISLEAALQLILSEIQPLGPVELPVRDRR